LQIPSNMKNIAKRRSRRKWKKNEPVGSLPRRLKRRSMRNWQAVWRAKQQLGRAKLEKMHKISLPTTVLDHCSITQTSRSMKKISISNCATQVDDMDSDANSVGSDASTDDEMVSGFQRVPSDDDAEGGWGNDSNTDSDNDIYVNDSDSDDDGFRGGKVRGEAYEEAKSIERQARKKAKKSKTKKKSSKKQKKNIMYEADGYGLEGADPKSASSSKKRKEIARMSLGDRMKMEKEKSGIVGETKRMNVKGDGITKEVSYIPKDVQRKREQEAMKMNGEDGEKKRRKRRGIKELGFKTPFKNRM